MSLKWKKILAGVATYSFNSRDRQISEFETSLIYRVSTRTVRAAGETLSLKTNKKTFDLIG